MNKNKQAFTLVELIVVITILAILWTIAFISLQWYSKDARDSTRLADLKSIEKALEFQLLKGSKIPKPDDFVEITASWTTISYQWYAWDGVLWKISVHWKGKDPLGDTYYTYLTDTKFSNYQLMWFLEWWELVSYGKNILNQTKAIDYSERHPLVRWKPLWIIVNSVTKEPIQVTWTGIDIVTEIDEYTAYLTNDKIITWTGSELAKIWSRIETFKSCKEIIDKYWYWINDWIYRINPIWNWFEVYCDMTTDWGGWTLVLSVWNHKVIDGWTTTWLNEYLLISMWIWWKLSDELINKIYTQQLRVTSDNVSFIDTKLYAKFVSWKQWNYTLNWYQTEHMKISSLYDVDANYTSPQWLWINTDNPTRFAFNHWWTLDVWYNYWDYTRFYESPCCVTKPNLFLWVK